MNGCTDAQDCARSSTRWRALESCLRVSSEVTRQDVALRVKPVWFHVLAERLCASNVRRTDEVATDINNQSGNHGRALTASTNSSHHVFAGRR